MNRQRMMEVAISASPFCASALRPVLPFLPLSYFCILLMDSALTSPRSSATGFCSDLCPELCH